MIFAIAVMFSLLANADLRITEIMPKMADAYDANGLESGWVELYNDGTNDVDLSNYELQRFNLGKKVSAGKYSKLPSRTVGAGQYAVIYTSDEYPNSKDEGGDDFTVITYTNGYVVAPFKVNPKKFPIVRLLKGKTVLQTEYIPVDIVPGYSYCNRTIMTATTKGEANNLTGAIAYGPNANPLYGVKHSLSVFDPLPRPKTNEAYIVRLPVNEYLGNSITNVTLHYHSGFDTANEKTVEMSKDASDATAGQWWTATIPAVDIPAAGQMFRYYVTIKEENGTDFGEPKDGWRSPSFLNPDDGFQYFGTVVEKDELDDPKLQTFHLFTDGYNTEQMDVDVDKQDTSKVPYNARCEIFDAQTGHFYDNVRIDLRGNTSGGFRKKSHGLRFAKCHELVCTNPFDGSKIETRKTSFIAEYCDPAYIRQSLAFYAFRNAGCLVPFDYPVRLNLNGEFYQLAFHSDRFSDKLIEDHYKLDKKGYSYKNIGTFSPLLSTTAGGIEKKTPDDGNEKDYAKLKAFCSKLAAAQNAQTDNVALTKTVVESFDLPAWINYLAAARITQECDDVWANLSGYYDIRGTDTWMPLGYDFNLTFGQHYVQDGWERTGAKPNSDYFKSHPFYGGFKVRCHVYPNGADAGKGNYAIESVWQSTKFRRLYLRRLRTLMDAQLKNPGTPKEETPFWRDYVVAFTNATWECAALDYKKWRYDNDWATRVIYVWPKALTYEEGLTDLWDNYVVPRREHLYVTHSITNTAKTVGYGSNLNAGIPCAQSELTQLAPKFTAEIISNGVLKISSANDEAVDMSGWILRGGVNWTLPAGCVVDANGSVYVVADRKSYVASTVLSDQVIVGNATFNSEIDGVRLESAEGEEVFNTLLPKIESVSENNALNRVTLVADLSAIAAAYGLDLTKDLNNISLAVTPLGGNPVTATIDNSGTATATWRNSSKYVTRQIEIKVSVSGKNVATGGDVVIVSNWKLWFSAMDEDAVRRNGEWNDGTFTVKNPDESTNKVVMIVMEGAWPYVESLTTGMVASVQTGIGRKTDGFYALSNGEWVALYTDAPSFNDEKQVVTLIELDYCHRTVRYWLCIDGKTYALKDISRNDKLKLAISGAPKMSRFIVIGNGTFSRIDGKLLSRNGEEFAGFMIRIK